ncbi:MAG: helix-hairpin-helix domain-containing protein [Clostridium sp.]|nr:helix-hairpin-helix domain-containing protein [Clostridium sp.]MCM1443952.1 helix-hairpin-helix domain-containing protein [Candidatus Amulumruptor caecigallinarius]
MKDFFDKYKVYIIIAILLIVGVITYFVITNFLEKNNTNDMVGNTKEVIEEIKEDKIKEELIVNTIKVDIKGSVKNPGVYELELGKRVIDLINMAGGLTKSADTTLINLSKILSDEMIVKIYTKDEVKAIKKGNGETVIKYIETECTCPDIKNDACITNKNNITSSENSKNENLTSNKISINTATLDQLTSLPSIGSAKAENIIEYRNSNGIFKTIEDIKNVSGIGESLFEKIKDYITI